MGSIKKFFNNNFNFGLFVFLFFGLFSFNIKSFAELKQDKDGVYQISSKEDLFEFAKIVNGGSGYENKAVRDAKAVLTQNIKILDDGLINKLIEIQKEWYEDKKSTYDKKTDKKLLENLTYEKLLERLTDEERATLETLKWTPIGDGHSGQNDEYYSYKGTFDGNGHFISGIYCDFKDYEHIGLFGFVEKEAEIKNLTVKKSLIGGYAPEEATEMNRSAGGILGKCRDGVKIINCHSEDCLFIVDSGNDYSNAGGIAGWCEGNVEKCDSKRNIVIVKTNSSDSFANSDAGGLIGLCFGQVTECNSEECKLITSSESSYKHNCCDSCSGGLIGRIQDGEVINCHSKNCVVKASVEFCSSSGGSYVGGFAGYSEGIVKECSAKDCQFNATIKGNGICCNNQYIGFSRSCK